MCKSNCDSHVVKASASPKDPASIGSPQILCKLDMSEFCIAKKGIQVGKVFVWVRNPTSEHTPKKSSTLWSASLPCLYLWFLLARYLQKDSVGFVATSVHPTPQLHSHLRATHRTASTAPLETPTAMGFWGFLDEQLQPYPCMDVFEWSIAVLESCQCEWLANWFLQKSLKSEEQRKWQRCLPTSTYHHEKSVWQYVFLNICHAGNFPVQPTSQKHVFASLPSPSRHLQTPTYSSLSKADQCKQYQRCTSGTSWGALAVTRFNTRYRKLLLCPTLITIPFYIL